jgi:hypothetical protein
MRRYQDLYDSCIARETQAFYKDAQAGQLDLRKFGVLNMLNTKYILYGAESGAFVPNDEANGPAWFVREVATVSTPTEALKMTGSVNTKRVAVIEDPGFKPAPTVTDTLSTIRLLEMKPPYMKYESASTTGGIGVFSEIYYPKGWHATIDGKEVPVLRADYVLRALEIPAGKHVIEFNFEPRPYTVGNKMTMASGWVLLLVVLGCVGWTWKTNSAEV